VQILPRVIMHWSLKVTCEDALAHLGALPTAGGTSSHFLSDSQAVSFA
jgi:hypothetical protein